MQCNVLYIKHCTYFFYVLFYINSGLPVCELKNGLLNDKIQIPNFKVCWSIIWKILLTVKGLVNI